MKGIYALVGMQFRSQAERDHLAQLTGGAPLMLKREPTNQYDPHAVQVWSGAFHVGYVKGNQVKPLAMAMDSAAAKAEMQATALSQPAKLALDGGKWPLIEVEE